MEGSIVFEILAAFPLIPSLELASSSPGLAVEDGAISEILAAFPLIPSSGLAGSSPGLAVEDGADVLNLSVIPIISSLKLAGSAAGPVVEEGADAAVVILGVVLLDTVRGLVVAGFEEEATMVLLAAGATVRGLVMACFKEEAPLVLLATGASFSSSEVAASSQLSRTRDCLRGFLSVTSSTTSSSSSESEKKLIFLVGFVLVGRAISDSELSDPSGEEARAEVVLAKDADAMGAPIVLSIVSSSEPLEESDLGVSNGEGESPARAWA